MGTRFTPQQAALLRFVRGYQLAHGGVSPSLAECAAGIGTVSRSSAQRILVSLERLGAIRRLPNRRRAIDILAPVAVPSIGGAPLFVVPDRKSVV